MVDMVEIHHQPIVVQLGTDAEEGALLFAGAQLLAVLVFLEAHRYANDPSIAGQWSVEIGFGACSVGSKTTLFKTLDAAKDWAARCFQPEWY